VLPRTDPRRNTRAAAETPGARRADFPPNFAALAEAVGLTGLCVEDPAEVRAVLGQALHSDGPVLADVVTDPNVLSLPPKATIRQAKGFALAMTKMAFTGELEDVRDTVAGNWRYP
jgi:pyruvate dehydrogenase (quinone)